MFQNHFHITHKAFIVMLVGLFLLTSCAPTRDLSVAPMGDQSIVIWHRASGERIDVTTRGNGSYNPNAFEQIDHIFRDRHTGEEYPIDPKLIDALAELRDKLMMSPSDPVELLSGYRSAGSNAKLSTTNKYVAKNSYHIRGQAADIRIPDMSSCALEAIAKTMQKGGVALYPDGGPDFGHVHVDTGPVRGWEVIHGREAGFDDARSRAGRSSSSSSSGSRFAKPVAEPRVKVKPINSPINSYDDLPEPVSEAAPKKAVPPATVKSKTGAPVHKPPVKKNLETAKKQWMKTPYHGKPPVSKKPAAKKPPVQRDINE